MTTFPNRQPRGISTGGEFAAAIHSEPDFALALVRGTTLPPRGRWSEKRIREAAEERHAAAETLKLAMAAADGALIEKQRSADQEFFDWDTEFTASTLGDRYRRKYLKDRVFLREMFSADPDYRYNREYTHKTVALLRESAQVLITRVLNKIEGRTGGDNEWYIRL